MALEGGGGGRGRREEEKNGEFRSPGSHIEGTCVLGEPKRTTFPPLLRVFAESKPCAHVCTALDLPWFRHVALQTLVGKPGKRRPLPRAPRYPSHPFSNSTLSPSPHFTMVTYSLAFQYLRCGDLGGVGSGGGGVCRGDIGVPLKGRSECLCLSPAAPRSSSFPSSSPRPLVSALVGRSRTLPPRRSPLQVSPRDPKPQGSRYRPFRHPKTPFREAWILFGVFTPKGLF